jgi:hypothetical protein
MLGTGRFEWLVHRRRRRRCERRGCRRSYRKYGRLRGRLAGDGHWEEAHTHISTIAPCRVFFYGALDLQILLGNKDVGRESGTAGLPAVETVAKDLE